MPTATQADDAFHALQRMLGTGVSRAPAAVERAASDFGGLVRRAPAMVVSPRGEPDVLVALDVANRFGVPVALRGAGHGQAGQCLSHGAIVLDMTRFAQVDIDGDTVEATGGTRWRSIVDAAYERHLRPVGPTHAFDTTIAGTLSVAGVGPESWRTGAQVNRVASLDVALMDGRVVRCSADHERELFNAVRGGLGQCGVILRARYPLQRCGAFVHSRVLRYTDPSRFIADVEAVCAREAATFVSGHLADGGLHLVLGEELARDETPGPSPLDDLNGTPVHRATKPLWGATGTPPHPFFRATGVSDHDPQRVHPWVEVVYGQERVLAGLEALLERPPVELSAGSNIFIFIARAGTPAPLFASPEGTGLQWGLGLVPSLPRAGSDEAVLRLAKYALQAQALGGKRYISGYVGFTSEAHWAAHFGAQPWSWFKAMKRQYDPKGLLSPGFITWEAQ